MSLSAAQARIEALLEQPPVESPIGAAARKAAALQYRESGLALERDEAWRFTDLRALERWGERGDLSGSERPPAPVESVSDPALEPPVAPLLERVREQWLLGPELSSAPCLVFLDGRLEAALSSTDSLPDGVHLGVLGVGAAPEPASGLRSELALGSIASIKLRALTALNSALGEAVAAIRIEPNVSLDLPLVIVHLSSGSIPLVHPRTWIELGTHSRASVIELHASPAAGAHVVNAVGEAKLAAGARLEHVYLQDHALETLHFAELGVSQERDSHFGSHSIALGGALARTEIRSVLAGEGAHARLHGLYIGDQSQVIDHYTTLDHAAPHTTSDELYKGILGGRAKGVFCGRVEVRPHAQKIDAKQTNRALLTSEAASVHTRPQLEIYADDVRCSHGASIGQLDPDALFYLRARGIGEAEARALLTRAFVEDALAELCCGEIAEGIRTRLLGPRASRA